MSYWVINSKQFINLMVQINNFYNNVNIFFKMNLNELNVNCLLVID